MNPVIEAVRQGSVPKPAKLAAARAMLPMTPEDSLEVLVLLARDEDEEIRGAATKSLNEFNKDQMKVVVSNKETAKDVLAHLCAWRSGTREIYEAIVLNLNAPGEGVADLAKWHRDASLLELITVNQQRVIECPSIIDAVLSNPSRSPEAERRAREIRVEFFEKELGAKRVAEERKLRAATVSAALGFSHVVDVAADLVDAEIAIEELFVDDKMLQEQFQIDLPPEEQITEPEILFSSDDLANADEIPLTEEQEAEVARITKEKEADEESLDEIQKKIVRLVAKLKTKTKVKLALVGNRQCRSILMRDSNKLVVSAVLSNPKITEQEVETMTKMKTLPEDALRVIGLNRAWIRSYPIIHNLVKHPRTPPATGMPLLNRLFPKDLKALVSNKNVPDMIRRQAGRIMAARTVAGGK
jgi:hypothetical protein